MNKAKNEEKNFSTCKIDSKNRITLSKNVLDFLNVESGDIIAIESTECGLCIHKAYISVRRKKQNGIGKRGESCIS